MKKERVGATATATARVRGGFKECLGLIVSKRRVVIAGGNRRIKEFVPGSTTMSCLASSLAKVLRSGNGLSRVGARDVERGCNFIS